MTTRLQCVGIGVLFASLALAQPPPAVDPADPAFKSEARIVEVAVIAKDGNGSTVMNLHRSDFRAFDNGAEQTILSFEKGIVSGQPAGGKAAEGAANEVMANGGGSPRLSIILLDSINGTLAARVSGRKAVSEMLAGLPAGENSIAVFALGDTLHLLHDFSTDLTSLRAAVDGYQAELSAVRAAEPAYFSGGFSLTMPVSAASGGDIYAELRLSHTLDAFREIARNMRNIPGEKNLLWLTAGFLPPEDDRDILAAMRELAAARVTLYPIDARGLVACPGGACPPEVNLAIASMEELAEQTGGKAFHDTNAIAASAREAMEDSREGYVLTYAPNNYVPDGSAHAVQLRTSRKGLDLRYRTGYAAN